jgi:hypothetical protein
MEQIGKKKKIIRQPGLNGEIMENKQRDNEHRYPNQKVDARGSIFL